MEKSGKRGRLEQGKPAAGFAGHMARLRKVKRSRELKVAVRRRGGGDARGRE